MKFFRKQRFIRISIVYPIMRRIAVKEKTEVRVRGVVGFIERIVTPFGNSGKVDCPKTYIGKRVYLIICRD